MAKCESIKKLNNNLLHGRLHQRWLEEKEKVRQHVDNLLDSQHDQPKYLSSHLFHLIAKLDEALIEKEANSNNSELEFIQDRGCRLHAKYHTDIPLHKQQRLAWVYMVTNTFARKEIYNPKTCDVLFGCLEASLLDIVSRDKAIEDYTNQYDFYRRKKNSYQVSARLNPAQLSKLCHQIKVGIAKCLKDVPIASVDPQLDKQMMRYMLDVEPNSEPPAVINGLSIR